MSPSIRFPAAIGALRLLLPLVSLLSGAAQAYTEVSMSSPFMTKNIDPILFPGQFNKSHLHSFFGSDAVTASTSTSAELQKGCTNAENPNDLSIYWIPTPLYTADGGKTYRPMPVFRFSAYYNLGETEAEVPIPQNLRMIAGDANAQTRAAMPAQALATWACEGNRRGDDDDGTAPAPAPLDANGFPSETCATHLQQLLYFPQCVNTATLETAYKDRRGGSCPAGMKSMPQLRFSIRYDLRKVLPRGWGGGTAPFKLACGPAWCSHGDFMNGWNPVAAANMVATTRAKQEFSGVDGPLGGFKDGTRCKAVDADPSHGTSDYAESVRAMTKRDVETWGWRSRSRLAE